MQCPLTHLDGVRLCVEDNDSPRNDGAEIVVNVMVARGENHRFEQFEPTAEECSHLRVRGLGVALAVDDVTDHDKVARPGSGRMIKGL